MEAHAHDLRAEVDDDEFVRAIKTDYAAAPLNAADRGLCEYAHKLTKSPSSVSEADVVSLRSLGLSDQAIGDAAQVIAYFNYINRIADGLGVDLEPGMPPRV